MKDDIKIDIIESKTFELPQISYISRGNNDDVLQQNNNSLNDVFAALVRITSVSNNNNNNNNNNNSQSLLLTSLPKETVIHCLEYLNAQELCRIAVTCKDLQNLSQHRQLWNHLLQSNIVPSNVNNVKLLEVDVNCLYEWHEDPRANILHDKTLLKSMNGKLTNIPVKGTDLHPVNVRGRNLKLGPLPHKKTKTSSNCLPRSKPKHKTKCKKCKKQKKTKKKKKTAKKKKKTGKKKKSKCGRSCKRRKRRRRKKTKCGKKKCKQKRKKKKKKKKQKPVIKCKKKEKKPGCTSQSDLIKAILGKKNAKKAKRYTYKGINDLSTSHINHMPNVYSLIKYGTYTKKSRSAILTSNNNNAWHNILASHSSHIKQKNSIFQMLRQNNMTGDIGVFYTWRGIENIVKDDRQYINHMIHASQDYMIASLAADYMISNQPLFTFISFSGPSASDRIYGRKSIGYEQSLIQTDGYIGWIIDALRDTNMIDNTIIAIVSDHSFVKHSHAYDICQGASTSCELMPLILFGPGTGINIGKTLHRESISNLDVIPTIFASVLHRSLNSKYLESLQWSGRVIKNSLNFLGEEGHLHQLINEYMKEMNEFHIKKNNNTEKIKRINELMKTHSHRTILDFEQYRQEEIGNSIKNWFHRSYKSYSTVNSKKLPLSLPLKWHSEIVVTINKHQMPMSPLRVMGVGNYSYNWKNKVDALRLYWKERTGESVATFYTTLHRYYKSAVERLCTDVTMNIPNPPPPPPPPKHYVHADVALPKSINVTGASPSVVTYAAAMAAEVDAPIDGPKPKVPKQKLLKTPGADKTAETSATASVITSGSPLNAHLPKYPKPTIEFVPNASETATTSASAAAVLANAPLKGPKLPTPKVKTLNIPGASETTLTMGASDLARTGSPMNNVEHKLPKVPTLKVPNAEEVTLTDGAAAAATSDSPLLGPKRYIPPVPVLKVKGASATALTSATAAAATTDSPILGAEPKLPDVPTLKVPNAEEVTLTDGAAAAATSGSPILGPERKLPHQPLLKIPGADPTALTSGAAAIATTGSHIHGDIPKLPHQPLLKTPGADPTALTSGAAAIATTGSHIHGDIPYQGTTTVLNIPGADPTALTSGAAAIHTTGAYVRGPKPKPSIVPGLNIPGADPTAIAGTTSSMWTTGSPIRGPKPPVKTVGTLGVPHADPTALTSGAVSAATSDSPLMNKPLKTTTTPVLNIKNADPTALASGGAAAATTGSPVLGSNIKNPAPKLLNIPHADQTALTSGAVAAAASGAHITGPGLPPPQVPTMGVPGADPTATTAAAAAAAASEADILGKAQREIRSHALPVPHADPTAIIGGATQAKLVDAPLRYPKKDPVPAPLLPTPNADPTATSGAAATLSTVGAPIALLEEKRRLLRSNKKHTHIHINLIGEPKPIPLRITDEVQKYQIKAPIQCRCCKRVGPNPNDCEDDSHWPEDYQPLKRCVIFPSRYNQGMRPPNVFHSSNENGKVLPLGEEMIDGIRSVDFTSNNAKWNLGESFHFFINASLSHTIPIRFQRKLRAVTEHEARQQLDLFEVWDFSQIKQYNEASFFPTPIIDDHTTTTTKTSKTLLIQPKPKAIAKFSTKFKIKNQKKQSCTIASCQMGTSFIEEYMTNKLLLTNNLRTNIKHSPYHDILESLKCCRRLRKEKKLEHIMKKQAEEPKKIKLNPAQVAHKYGLNEFELKHDIDDTPLELAIASLPDGIRMLGDEDKDKGLNLVQRNDDEWDNFHNDIEEMKLNDRLNKLDDNSIWDFQLNDVNGIKVSK